MRYPLCLLAALLFSAGCTSLATQESSSRLATDPITKIGRFQIDDAHHVKFTWPGSELRFRVEATHVVARLSTNERVRFALDVNGKVQDLWLEPGERDYVLATATSPTIFDIRLTRLTESFAIVTALEGLPRVDGKWLDAPAASPRRLLVIGDSITAGYGVEGADQHCSYAKETSNQQLTYAALAANNLKADLHAIAWSGIGVWRSYGEDAPKQPSMLIRNTRTLADDKKSVWSPADYQPQAVLINLGTNDFWQAGAESDYAREMNRFVTTLKRDYPNTAIYLLASPMLGGEVRLAQKRILKEIAQGQGVNFADLGKIESGDGLGCDYHPSRVTQARLGEVLTQTLKHDLAW